MTDFLVDSDTDHSSEELQQEPDTLFSSSSSASKREKSWMYQHSEKKEENGNSFFFCLVKDKRGKTCNVKVSAQDGNTAAIGKHLNRKHQLKKPVGLVQASIS